MSAPKFKHWRPAAGAAILLAVIAIAVLVYQPKEDVQPVKPVSGCGAYRDDKTVTINKTQIKAEVVQNQAKRAQGLSSRPCIEPDRGMLFIFDKPGQYAIWMKDMKFPIDIVWINTDHKTVGLEVNVDPSTYPDRFVNKDHPAQYVLELKANRAKELGVGLGTTVSF